MSFALVLKSYPSLFSGVPFFHVPVDGVAPPPHALIALKTFKGENGKSIRKNYRSGFLVDQPWAQEYLDRYKDYPVFTALDCVGPNVVNVPLGFMMSSNISQSPQYYTQYDPQLKHFGKVFWKGSLWTHDTRGTLLSHLKGKADRRFLLRNWYCEQRPYGPVKPPSIEYTSYFKLLTQADAFLVMRGDLPWLYSFFDCLRAGAIPVCVNTFYGNLGWENIGIKTSDLLLDLKTTTHTLDQIYEEIVSLIEDKERVLHMKRIGQHFMRNYVLNDCLLRQHGANVYLCGWGDFIAAKCLETIRNGYTLVNQSFISPLVNEIKHEVQSQKVD